MIIRCVWCGWAGSEDDLDMNERDEPAYCPECGHSTFDIKPTGGDKNGRNNKEIAE